MVALKGKGDDICIPLFADNMAIGKTCNVSSQLPTGRLCEAANDNNKITSAAGLLTNCFSSNVYVNNSGRPICNPYWAVDLGKRYSISHITIYGGTGGKYFSRILFEVTDLVWNHNIINLCIFSLPAKPL